MKRQEENDRVNQRKERDLLPDVKKPVGDKNIEDGAHAGTIAHLAQVVVFTIPAPRPLIRDEGFLGATPPTRRTIEPRERQ